MIISSLFSRTSSILITVLPSPRPTDAVIPLTRLHESKGVRSASSIPYRSRQ